MSLFFMLFIAGIIVVLVSSKAREAVLNFAKKVWDFLKPKNEG